MSSQIDVARVQQFKQNIFHLSQQKGSALRQAVMVESQQGKAAFYDRLGKVTPQLRTSRHSDSPIIDTPHSRRMVTLKDYEWGDMVDKQDLVRMIEDPTSKYVQAAMWSLGRGMDDEIIAAALGNAYGGEAGASSVALGTGQRVVSVASTAISNLNVQALRKAKYILDNNDVDPSLPRYIAINAKMLEGLLQDTAVTSADYNSVKALVQGELDTFLGFKFIRTQRLVAPSVAFTFNTTTGLYSGGGTSVTLTTSKSAICWAGDALLLAVGQDMMAEVGPRADKGFNTYAYASMSIGATRLEEEKVVEIICSDA